MVRMPSVDPSSIDHMDVPQFHRKVVNLGSPVVSQSHSPLPSNTDELDLPTFMRRDRN